jgi:phenol 2-monooxygenase
MLIPREAEKVRLYIELGDAPPADVQTGRAEAKKANAEDMLALARTAFTPYSMTTTPDKVDWWTNYIVGQRVASKFSVSDRVFIAGDACHTHSPKGGLFMLFPAY